MDGSDHVQGLEGAYNAPFVYCSAATKEVLPFPFLPLVGPAIDMRSS